MGFYVDPVVYRYNGEEYSHLWADTIEELNRIGAKLKLDPYHLWVPPLSFGHPVGYYMVNSADRAKAIKLGATEVDKHQMPYECAVAKWDDAEIERIENIRAWG